MIIEKDLSEITIGTYVIDITEQKNRYNLSNFGWIKSSATIEQFKKKGVQRLLVDTSKQRVKIAHTKEQAPQVNTFMASLGQAKALFDESKNIQKKLFKEAKAGAIQDLAPVLEVTNKSVEAIFESPDALACILNVRLKDEYLLEHSIAVSILIAIFARHLNIDIATAKELSVGAFLHDVGKIKVPDAILNKPGKLTDKEFTIMKTHVSHSVDLIKAIPEISALSLEVAALHHEKQNGQGYPAGISAQDISIYGRMIAICDIFDALTSSRCYKSGYPQVKAFSILRSLAQDNQLDPVLVDAFIKCMGVYPIGSLVTLSSDRLAIVKVRNHDDLTKPTVEAFFDVKLQRFEIPEIVDLSAKQQKIVKCVRANEYGLNMEEIIEYLSGNG